MSLERNKSHISREYDALTRLFGLQSDSTKDYFRRQAASIVTLLGQNKSHIQFELPEQVCWGESDMLDIAPVHRKQVTNGRLWGTSHLEMRNQLILQLNRLEKSTHAGLAVSGKLLRYTIVQTIVYALLPDGLPVCYQPEADDDIPSIPVDETSTSSRSTSREEMKEFGDSNQEAIRFQIPYVNGAQRFFVPKWVAFGEEDQMLTASFLEAETFIYSLQNAVRLLQDAEAICNSIVADEAYQRKRAGLLGQLVNQGRALARSYTRQIITRIHAKAETGDLDRGLQISLPYFEINDLAIHLYPVNVIPKGRIKFIPEFLVLAMQQTAWKVQQDPQINTSSRRHLLAQLASIENSFNKYLD